MIFNMASTSTENVNNKENPEEKPAELIPGFATIEDFTKNGFKTLIEATRNSNSLPQDRDWDFYNTHQSFRNLMSKEGDDILHLINNILKEQAVHGNIKNRDTEEKIELIVEANDTILERVANNLDEIAGIKRNPELPVEIQAVSAQLPVNGSWNKLNNATFTVSSRLPLTTSANVAPPNAIRLLTGKNIQRPQASFKDKIDNSPSPWEPRIKDKSNSLKPLAIFLEETEDGLGEVFSHPYEFELDRFEPTPEQLTYVTPVKPKPLEDTPLRMVSTPEALDVLLEDLRGYKEIAVDLEHHSYRTFLGITCLMQISTGDTDYIIDTLTLRDKLHVLNEVFTKATIVKVFHGADNDIEWLQRDLSLYIVNMFDTHQAARQLGYTQLSLAYLLRKFCQIDANKHFQLADWRIRPLPEELQTYAREDTHYLLYIYHIMRDELLDTGNKSTNILMSVIRSSTNICKRRYVKPVLHDTSHLELYRKCKKLFDNRQMYALKHLYKWRDETSRMEDESTGFVLPNHMMLQIAELLPREMQGVLACCNPIPPLVRANLLELHKIILRARDQSVVKPILSDVARSRGSTQHTAKLNVDNVLHCPHDLSKSEEEFRDDLPTLLDARLKQKQVQQIHAAATDMRLVQNTPRISAFRTPDNSDTETNPQCAAEMRRRMKQIKFLGPYERYKMVKRYVQAEDDQEKADAAEKVKKNNNKTVERSDDDRISALHKHFIQVSTVVPQIQPTETTDKNTSSPTPEPEHAPAAVRKGVTTRQLALSQMAGRKRKRPMFEQTEYSGGSSQSQPPPLQSLDGSEQVLDNTLHTPVPNTHPRAQRHNNRQQRASTRIGTEGEAVEEQQMSKTQLRKLKKLQKKQQRQQQLQSSDATPDNTPQQQQQQRQTRKQHQRQQQQQRQSSDQVVSGTEGTTSNNTPQQQQQQQKRKKQGVKRKANQQQTQENNQVNQNNIPPQQQQERQRGFQQRVKRKAVRNQQEMSENNQEHEQQEQQQQQSGGKKRKHNENNRGEDNFTPFDYSVVDFRQYQGGAGSAHKPKDIRSNFKNRGQNNRKFQNIGRNNNRSSTFGGNRGGNRGGGSRGGARGRC